MKIYLERIVRILIIIFTFILLGIVLYKLFERLYLYEFIIESDELENYVLLSIVIFYLLADKFKMAKTKKVALVGYILSIVNVLGFKLIYLL